MTVPRETETDGACWCVRLAGSGDGPQVRRVRLQALADAPDDFAAEPEAEPEWTDGQWSDWIARGGTFLLEGPEGPMGLAAAVPAADGSPVSYLESVWVHPRLRRCGASDALVAAVVGWAREHAATAMLLEVDPRNGRARRFYERCGFCATGREVRRETDGLPEIEMRLPLDKAGGA